MLPAGPVALVETVITEAGVRNVSLVRPPDPRLYGRRTRRPPRGTRQTVRFSPDYHEKLGMIRVPVERIRRPTKAKASFATTAGLMRGLSRTDVARRRGGRRMRRPYKESGYVSRQAAEYVAQSPVRTRDGRLPTHGVAVAAGVRATAVGACLGIDQDTLATTDGS